MGAKSDRWWPSELHGPWCKRSSPPSPPPLPAPLPPPLPTGPRPLQLPRTAPGQPLRDGRTLGRPSPLQVPLSPPPAGPCLLSARQEEASSSPTHLSLLSAAGKARVRQAEAHASLPHGDGKRSSGAGNPELINRCHVGPEVEGGAWEGVFESRVGPVLWIQSGSSMPKASVCGTWRTQKSELSLDRVGLGQGPTGSLPQRDWENVKSSWMRLEHSQQGLGVGSRPTRGPEPCTQGLRGPDSSYWEPVEWPQKFSGTSAGKLWPGWGPGPRSCPWPAWLGKEG